MSKRFLITIGTLLVIAVSAGIAIMFVKGYTFSPESRSLVGTGIIAVNSEPDAASVYIDGHLTTATDATISSLPPKEYDVKVVKEGFIPWEKKVSVKEGLVTDLQITLFPAIPSIYPLTFNGVKNPILSPDGSKLSFIVPTSTSSAAANRKAGVWVWTLDSNQPIAFARGAEPHQIAKSDEVDYSNAELRWSPDSKQVLAKVGNNNYILNENNLNNEPRDITPVLTSTLKSWDDELSSSEKSRILGIKDLSVQKIASGSASLKWSPDETKFIYSDKKSKNESGDSYKVYDIENKSSFDLPSAKSHLWLPDSRHVILVEDQMISIVSFDGLNKAVIYAGRFEDSFVFPWPDSSRLVIISSVPTPTASEPNLFGINLK